MLKFLYETFGASGVIVLFVLFIIVLALVETYLLAYMRSRFGWGKATVDLHLYKVGVIGFSAKEFNTAKAQAILNECFRRFKKVAIRGKVTVEIVSGLTDLGVPALAYREAKKFKFVTVGIAPECVAEHQCFPVNKKIIFGKKWGDESATFLKYIDCLLRIGGGDQSEKEWAAFVGPKWRYDISPENGDFLTPIEKGNDSPTLSGSQSKKKN